MLLYSCPSRGQLHVPCNCKVRTMVKSAGVVSGLNSQTETRVDSIAQSSSNTQCKSLLVLFLVLPHTSSVSAVISSRLYHFLLSSFPTPLPLKSFLTSSWAQDTPWQAAQLIDSQTACVMGVCAYLALLKNSWEVFGA